jgi:hypothetical protein
MNWFDIFLVLLIATITALGIKRRLVGAIMGLAALPLIRIFMIIDNPWIGIPMSLLAGVLVGFLGRAALLHRRGLEVPSMVLGGLGGFLTSLLFVGLMITSLPINYDKINNTYIYPPKYNLSPLLAQTFQGSQLVGVGRDILLYPLLDKAGQIPAGQRGPYKVLHSFLVVGQPWERSQQQ